MTFHWTADLETGNGVIDEQHKSLIKALSDFVDACKKREGYEQIEKTAVFLINYTNRHFQDEELLALTKGFPCYKEHKKMHDDFKKVALGLFNELKEKGITFEMVAKINDAMSSWLINHIMKEDKKIADHIKNLYK